MSDQEKKSSGVTEDMIRISVGTEHIDDIIHDFEQSFAASQASKPEASSTSIEVNKDVTALPDRPADSTGAI